MLFEESFLIIGDIFVLIEGLNDLGADEDNDICFAIDAVIFREREANQWYAAEARDRGFEARFAILDHAAQDDEVLVGHLDACGEIGVGCRNTRGRIGVCWGGDDFADVGDDIDRDDIAIANGRGEGEVEADVTIFDVSRGGNESSGCLDLRADEGEVITHEDSGGTVVLRDDFGVHDDGAIGIDFEGVDETSE